MDSLITTQNKVDPAVALTSSYRFNSQDRQYIDNQILGCEQHLASSLINGVHATWVMLDGSSAPVVIGDVVCSASTSTTVATATKATAGALASAGSALGVCLSAASAGGMVLVALSGLVAKSVTGLAASALGVVRVSNTARCEKVASLTTGDFLLGSVDSAGFLSLAGRIAQAASSGAAPAGVNGDLQMKNGASLAASHINDDGTNVTVNAAAGGVISLKVNGISFFSVGGVYSYMWMPLYFPDTSTPAQTGSGGVMWSAGGYPNWIDNAGFVHQLAEYRIALNADFNSTTTVALQSTNLVFPAVAGEVWEIEFGGLVSQASGVAGCAFGFSAPGTTTMEGIVEGSTSNSTTWDFKEMLTPATAYGVFNTVAATKGAIWGKVTMTIVGASGNVTLQVKPLAAVVCTLKAGFSLTAKKIKKV